MTTLDDLRDPRFIGQEGMRERAAVEISDLAMMLRRMIWMARKETGDTSMKVLAGSADQLLAKYGLQGSPLRDNNGQST